MAISEFSIGAALSTLGPLARQNLFLFEIDRVPTIGGGSFNSVEDIRFSAESATVPKSTNEPMIIPWMNSEYKIPGITKYENISVNFRVSEQNNMRIYDIINNWYLMIYKPSDGVQLPPARIMTNGKITLLNYQGERKKTWQVYHLFPTNCGGTTLTRDSGDKQTMTIDFAYTYAQLETGL